MSNVKETKEVVTFALALGQAVGRGMEDGKLDVSDLVLFLQAVKMAEPALKGVKEVASELASLDQAGKDEIMAEVAQFDIPQEHVETVVKLALSIGLDLVELLGKLKK